MKLSVHDIVLAAKRHEIEELRQLAGKAQLAGVLGHLIHSLQKERGASSIYLASGGQRFTSIRTDIISENLPLEDEVRILFKEQLGNPQFGSARLFSLMAWILLGLDALPALREQIGAQQLKADEAVAAFSRLIAGLVSLIFEVANSAVDPHISRSLVALFHFIQGKEQAGQERAMGALCFASSLCDAVNHQRILHLIEAQERSFQVFSEFADENAVSYWQELQATPAVIQLERLRRTLLASRSETRLDSNLSDRWFECCSDRLAGMWALQSSLVYRLQERCAQLIDEAERNLSDSEGLIASLRQHPPVSTERIDRFFDPNMPIDSALHFLPDENAGGTSGLSLIALLQQQSARLASMEGELDKARRALNERKLIERAKGVLMARLGIPEEEAYKLMRKTAMDQGKRIVDIAELTLALPAFIPTAH